MYNTRYRLYMLMILFVSLLCGICAYTAKAQDAALEPDEETAAVAEKESDRQQKLDNAISAVKSLDKSMAVIEVTVRYDKGEEPFARGYIPWASRSLEEYVHEERPVELPAYVLSDQYVIAPALDAPGRFVKEVTLRFGEQTFNVTPERYFNNQYAVLYKTDEPIQDAQPLEFDGHADGPYFMIQRVLGGGVWRTVVESLPASVVLSEAKSPQTSTNTYCLIINEEGVSVGMGMNGELPADGSWRGSPMDWAGPTTSQLQSLLDATEDKAQNGIYRVTLEFRSPKKKPGQGYSRYGYEDENQTERQTVGIALEGGRLLVLSSLKPKVTARLERIRINRPEGEPVSAKFAYTLKDYGCFVAELNTPLESGISLSEKDILPYVDKLLPAAEAKIRGEELVTYFQQLRIPQCKIGWRRHIYPTVFGPEWNLFLFDTDGTLLALPVARRQKLSVEDSYGYGYGEEYPQLTAASYLVEALADPDTHADPNNIPLTEDEEERLAWLGVELQPMDTELARANDVSNLTNNGQTGVLVTYVYPGSPADEQGLQQGDILLRIISEDEPKPIDIQFEDTGYYSRGPFPWHQLTEVPDQYLDEIPRPWPPAENTLTRTLTNLGFGKDIEVELYRDGKTLKLPFTITQSPRHFDTAAKYKSDDLGLTVKNMTYELRRFFRRDETEPGVIVAKVEPGSKASVAGLRPYEIITHIDDQPVPDVETFGELLDRGTELRFSVKRWTKGRVVKMELDAPEAPAEEQAEQQDSPTEDAVEDSIDEAVDAVEEAAEVVEEVGEITNEQAAEETTDEAAEEAIEDVGEDAGEDTAEEIDG